jgi:hypothetical protein
VSGCCNLIMVMVILGEVFSQCGVVLYRICGILEESRE